MSKLKQDLADAIQTAKQATAHAKNLKLQAVLANFDAKCLKRFGRHLSVGDLLDYTDLDGHDRTVRIRQLLNYSGYITVECDQLVGTKWLTPDNWDKFARKVQYNHNSSFDVSPNLFAFFKIRLSTKQA